MVRDSLLSREIGKLKERLLLIGGEVERALGNAVRSVEDRDRELAARVVEHDAQIDRLEVDLEEECLKILALYQPVATDLRFIVTVLKVNNDLERIGDLAANIAEYTLMLDGERDITFSYDFATMASKTRQMLTASLDALVNRSSETAHRVIMADDEVDEIHRQMYGKVEAKMKAHPELMAVLIKHIGISRCLERVGDLATNIAEDVIYLVTGEIVRH